MRNLLILLTLFAFAACEQAAEMHEHDDEQEAMDLDAVKAELQAMEDAFAKAWNAGDAEGVVAYYADDAISLPPEQEPIVGKAAILTRIQEELADETEGETQRYEVVDVWASGDLAVEVGRSFTRTAEGERESGKYVSIFEKRGGKYVCVRDIYSSNSDDDDDDDTEDED